MTYAEFCQKWARFNPRGAGFVGDGWVPILDQLLTDLTAAGWDGEIRQIKEKFGGLRFYASTNDPAHYDRIMAAELNSTKVCETCGQPGTVAGKPPAGRWLKALCESCRLAAWAAQPPINDP